ncbi:MAG: mechanosensitive ion channel domain-containing protein [Candidatus Micrarchaeota archaeon]
MRKHAVFFIVLLLIIVAITYLIESVLPSIEQQYNIPKSTTLLLNKAFIALLLITFTFVLTYLIEGLLRGAFYALSEENVRTILNILRYSLIAFATIMIIFVFIGDFSAFTLFSGLIGAGLAIALQQPILSITGWLVIISSHPYRIGHRVEVDNIRGDVINIRLFFTDLVEFGEPGKGTETGRLIHMSNSLVLQKAVINYTSDSP